MQNASELYLDLLKKSLSFSLWQEPPQPLGMFVRKDKKLKRKIIGGLDKIMMKRGVRLMRLPGYTDAQREGGEVWPGYADTMVGAKRLNNLQYCVETVIEDKVPGDLIETGVWRGGACILMRAILAVHGETDRRVFVADSFEGLPPADADQFPADAGDIHSELDALAVSEEDVKENFRRYGMLDDQVVFLKGFFEDTLHKAPIDQLAVLRLDGDMYSSTMDAFKALYDKLSVGGFCIIDDYALPNCAAAVHDFRKERGITDEMIEIDNISLYWRKTA